MLIKVILVAPLLLIVLLFLARLKNQIFYRSFFILIAGVGVFLVLNPNITTDVAHALGVGRGTDLILYLSVLFFFMFSILIYAKFRRLEAAQTELARQVAILAAKRFTDHK
ncbi:MAG: DUF2304 domain-containing protein [Chitinophagales bacterium]|nr:DUF2304 domain-containing protein [Chitinophagales bacterium]MCO5281534.1 DUF2304 domain-containing protein [Chitinophagales bacterium]HRN95254.1 DUF2304 domain-containing protein [Chitinophagales bacterium]HRP39027.1 DUF2304 domain-containing protein [Chitinophagales bacterium]